MGRGKTVVKRQRVPIICIVCEGKNRTERNYFNKFKNKNNPYRLIIVDAMVTDIVNMDKKCNSLIKEYQLDKKIGDHVFCVFDLDVDPKKAVKYQELKGKNKKIEYIASNPCFEAWLLYYFEKSPKAVNSSKAEVAQLKKHCNNYEKNLDIADIFKWDNSHHLKAMQNEKANTSKDEFRSLPQLNPYTEVPKILEILLQDPIKG